MVKNLIAALLLTAGAFIGATSAAVAQENKAPVVELGLRGDLVYGDPNAPIEVVEYGSFTCPHCAHFAAEIFPKIKADFVDTGKVRFIFRNFIRDRYDLALATISRCTTDPAVARALTEDFFVKQEEWIKAPNPYEVMAAIASAQGVDQQAMGECITDESLQGYLIEVRNFGIETYKLNTVPAMLVNGVVTKGYSYEILKEAIEAAH